MRGFPGDSSAVVIGASGGIGGALVRALLADRSAGGGFAAVVALSRREAALPAGAVPGRIDLLDENSVAAAAREVTAIAPPRLVLVATGWLGTAPEKSWRALDADSLVESFRRNAVGPALAMKHFLPLLPEGRAVFAALSARVGSISDNRLGGWHGYRASKAALNMLLRNGAIELARTRPEALCVGLHPGTVDTALSRPFQRGVAEGKLFTPDFAAERLLAVLSALGPGASGGVYAWDGAPVPP